MTEDSRRSRWGNREPQLREKYLGTQAKLTQQQREEIREALAEGVHENTLAVKYGVSRTTIRNYR